MPAAARHAPAQGIRCALALAPVANRSPSKCVSRCRSDFSVAASSWHHISPAQVLCNLTFSPQVATCGHASATPHPLFNAIKKSPTAKGCIRRSLSSFPSKPAPHQQPSKSPGSSCHPGASRATNPLAQRPPAAGLVPRGGTLGPGSRPTPAAPTCRPGERA